MSFITNALALWLMYAIEYISLLCELPLFLVYHSVLWLCIDLYGLIMFLGVDPVCVKKWWDQLLYKPYCADNKLPLEQVMSQVMWRTSKADVVDQVHFSYCKNISF